MSWKSPFERATPESQGVVSQAIVDFIVGVEAQHLGLHSMMLLRHGRVVAEGWWRPFTPAEPHILYSLTKSFTSMAAGLAISEGRFNLDDAVLSFFPQYAPKNPSDHWRAMRMRHLLSMATGHETDPSPEIRKLSPHEGLPALFKTPLPYAPGTHFVYNSIASHIVSMIVQKTTGQTLVSYLRDRLFRPLGIGRSYWETDPLGHNWGGWGLYLRTDEIARFGQMLLDRGRWQGKQIVPEAWVDLATSKQIDNGDDPDSDWAQGYGFQFWMSRHGFRGDGAFGQFCVVLPQHDAVLVTTASTSDMQAILNVAWQTVLPGLQGGSLPENPTAQTALQDRLAHLEIEGPQGFPASPAEAEIFSRSFQLDENPLGWQAVQLRRDGATLLFALKTANGEAQLGLGTADWQQGQVGLDMPMVLPVAGRAGWAGENTLDAALVYLYPAATRTFSLRFNADAIEIRTRLTGTFAPPTETTLTGRAAGGFLTHTAPFDSAEQSFDSAEQSFDSAQDAFGRPA